MQQRSRTFGSVLIAALVALASQSHAQTVFSDDTFTAANWTANIVFGAGSGTTLQDAGDGSPLPGSGPPSRRTTHNYSSQMYVAHLETSAIWNPATQGPVTSIDYSYYTRVFTAGAVLYTPLIKQGDSYYLGGGGAINMGLWQSTSGSALTAASFTLLIGSGGANPDFTGTGTPLELGYLTANSGASGPTTTVSNIDDWSISVHFPDSDGDGVWDDVDNCPDDPNPGQEDVVHPGGDGDACEDFDSDTVVDADDNCPDDANMSQANGDTDSLGDACDNCPSVDNESQTNGDTDTLGDACDNCPADDNESQTDSDVDGLGNVCDPVPGDADFDGDDWCDGPVAVPGTCTMAGDNCPLNNNPNQVNVCPAGLNPGDQYRLAFVTSTQRDATSSDIADYNTFVQNVAGSVTDLANLGASWTAIASTSTVDARDNTNTNPASGPGVPMYNLAGQRIAAGNPELWDGFLDPGAPILYTESGTSLNATAWSGTYNLFAFDPLNGTKFVGPYCGPLGDGVTFDSVLGLSNVSNGLGWIGGGNSVFCLFGFAPGVGHSQTASFFALSSELTVPSPPPAPVPALGFPGYLVLGLALALVALRGSKRS
jgi:hypothetical protein